MSPNILIGAFFIYTIISTSCKYFKFLLLSVFVLICKLGFSQDPPTDPPTDPSASVPLDGGLLVMAAVGVAYGVKSYKAKKKGTKK